MLRLLGLVPHPPPPTNKKYKKKKKENLILLVWSRIHRIMPRGTTSRSQSFQCESPSTTSGSPSPHLSRSAAAICSGRWDSTATLPFPAPPPTPDCAAAETCRARLQSLHRDRPESMTGIARVFVWVVVSAEGIRSRGGVRGERRDVALKARVFVWVGSKS